MNYLEGFLLLVHVGVAAAICGFVLLQHGKGADMGAAFGSGSSGSLFGASGSANFLSHTTAVLAAVFFFTSIGLTWYASTHGQRAAVMERSVLDKGVPGQTTPANPAAPAGAGAPAPGTAPAGSALPAAPAAPAAPGSKAGEVPK
jgi:preprotein translocase subunit SecG